MDVCVEYRLPSCHAVVDPDVEVAGPETAHEEGTDFRDHGVELGLVGGGKIVEAEDMAVGHDEGMAFRERAGIKEGEGGGGGTEGVGGGVTTERATGFVHCSGPTYLSPPG